MPTLFERIIAREIPGRFVWSDPVCVGFLTITPITPGHILIVPRTPVDHWLDAPDDLMNHLVASARTVGRAQLAEFGGERSGLVVQGYGVPHLHLHVFASSGPEDFERLDAAEADGDDLDAAADRLRRRLLADGASGAVADQA
ncbi:HIT family protein [Litorihabitans aurantiacus]|uniref:HIT domain-containing protein n=1 Tax=Litorihabitans aurantiacus TaxID=1930061 RepID=A0AA37XDX9_9MICO|nr:HIT family protein [Litorihabitans aurantiacus]GMA31412.1 hypothetical protein GCM10025875_14040 [Litorihabitans aurantiacus]